MHLASAQQSSQMGFSLLKSDCKGVLNNSCVSLMLFFNPDILDNFPHFQNYLSVFGTNDFILATKELLPETITASHELLPFFLIAQLTELLFHKYDFNNSLQIELGEFRELAQGLIPKITESIPQVHNNYQGEQYLRYAIKKGNFPFLMEKGDRFSSIRFSHWVIHPKNTKIFLF